MKLNTGSKIRLNSFAKIARGQLVKAEVHAYTDKRSTLEYNRELSKRRTNNEIAFLISQGLKSDELIMNYYGELNPGVGCKKQRFDNEDDALNRIRVVKLIKNE
ncbi:MAG: outer membrane protein OmpA-like peptidoglycan-associated protein [Vicingaceae bacterium]